MCLGEIPLTHTLEMWISLYQGHIKVSHIYPAKDTWTLGHVSWVSRIEGLHGVHVSMLFVYCFCWSVIHSAHLESLDRILSHTLTVISFAYKNPSHL